ncbi:DUF4136 domain-containing protein [Pseudaeromonas paramecii]|uniref:DUF4136 domain-containing protein n=1 Tax=Pseudaeromonas paramecii TaxID=2138166 RepID=A0ABP8QH54_9GAMM
MTKSLPTIALFSLLTACQSAPPSQVPPSALPLVVVSGGLQTHLAAEPSFAVATQGNHVWLEDATAAANVENQISLLLTQRLIEGGLPITASDQARYRFRFELGTDKLLTDADLQQRWGLNPGYAGSSRYPKGAMVLDLVDAQSGRSVWRGAVQSDVMPASMDPAQRQARMVRILDQLLGQLKQQFPASGL